MGYLSWQLVVLRLAFAQVADAVPLVQIPGSAQKPDSHLVDIGEQLTKQHQAMRQERLAKEKAEREAAEAERSEWSTEHEARTRELGATGRVMQKVQVASSVGTAEDAAFKRAVNAAAASAVARGAANAAAAEAKANASSEASTVADSQQLTEAEAETIGVLAEKANAAASSAAAMEAELRPSAELLPAAVVGDFASHRQAESEIEKEVRQQKLKKFDEDQGRVESEERIFQQKRKNMQKFQSALTASWKEEADAQAKAQADAEFEARQADKEKNATKAQQQEELARRRAAKQAAGVVPTYVDPAVKNRLGQRPEAEKGLVYAKMSEEKRQQAEHAKWLLTPEGQKVKEKEERDKARVEKRQQERIKNQEEWEARRQSKIEQSEAKQLRMTKRYQDKQDMAHSHRLSVVDKQRKRIEGELDKAAEAQMADVKAITAPSSQPASLEKMNMVGMMDTLRTISTAVKDPELTNAVNNASSSLKSSVVRFAQKADMQVKMFVEGSQNASQEELATMLSKLFEGCVKLFDEHQSDTNVFLRKIEGNMPAKLKRKVGPVLAMIMPASVSLNMDAAKLADISSSKACGQASSVMDQLTPLYANLTRVHSVLNQSAKYVPMLDSLLPSMDPAVTTLATSLVNLGFTETIAMEGVTSDLLKTVGPIIEDKFHCTWTATSRGARAALNALLAVLAASRVAL